MQTFKLTKSQLTQMMRDFNQQRKQSLQNIKTFYQQIQTKQINIFDTPLQRLTLNLNNFKNNKYKKMHSEINHNNITQKYQHKLNKIDKQISKLEHIIQNGVGKIVEKPLTQRVVGQERTSRQRTQQGLISSRGTQQQLISRISITDLGSQSRRSISQYSNIDNTVMYLKSPTSNTTLQNGENKKN